MKRSLKLPLKEEAKPKRTPQDLKQLTDLHRGAYSSQNALVAIIEKIRAQGIPTASSRTTQQRARTKISCQETPYGPSILDFELPLEPRPLKIALGNPFAMLYRTFDECVRFRSVLLERFAAKPCSPSCPWSLILYFDGISPNNPLDQGVDEREMQCVYWTFAELDHLHDEDFWFTTATCRAFLTDKKFEGVCHVFLVA